MLTYVRTYANVYTWHNIIHTYSEYTQIMDTLKAVCILLYECCRFSKIPEICTRINRHTPGTCCIKDHTVVRMYMSDHY